VTHLFCCGAKYGVTSVMLLPMATVAAINLFKIAKIAFAITFAILLGVLLRNQRYIFSGIFVAIFIAGWFIQKWKYFWRICLVFFGLLSVMFLFGALGGLEPNRQGILSSGNWLTLNFFLFLTSLFSALLSLFAGVIAERQHNSASYHP